MVLQDLCGLYILENVYGLQSDNHMTHPPPIIGLTGNIGCGKSAVAQILEELGCLIIDADVLAREVVLPGTPGLAEIAEQFGSDFLASDGSLDRAALGQLVFSDKQKRQKLEKILHPRIRELFLAALQCAQTASPPPPAIVYVVPLLFESDYPFDELDFKLVVAAPRELCIERIMARDKCSRSVAVQRYDAQLPIEQKIELADSVIHNDSSLEILRQHTLSAYNNILEKRRA